MSKMICYLLKRLPSNKNDLLKLKSTEPLISFIIMSQMIPFKIIMSEIKLV